MSVPPNHGVDVNENYKMVSKHEKNQRLIKSKSQNHFKPIGNSHINKILLSFSKIDLNNIPDNKFSKQLCSKNEEYFGINSSSIPSGHDPCFFVPPKPPRFIEFSQQNNTKLYNCLENYNSIEDLKNDTERNNFVSSCPAQENLHTFHVHTERLSREIAYPDPYEKYNNEPIELMKKTNTQRATQLLHPLKYDQTLHSASTHKHLNNQFSISGISQCPGSQQLINELQYSRNTLRQGLNSLEGASTWYKTQMKIVNENIQTIYSNDTALLGNFRSMKFSSFLPKLLQANDQLKNLIEYLNDDNKANNMYYEEYNKVTHHHSQTNELRTVARLKAQNKLLTKEVSEKSNKISSLEREKSALLKELFEAKAAQPPAVSIDSTFL